MPEILKPKLMLNIMKTWKQSVTKLSGKPQKENTPNIISQRIEKQPPEVFYRNKCS